MPRFVNTFFIVTRPNEEADGRLRCVLGDGLAAEGGEDRHGYQPQGGRRTCLNRSFDICFIENVVIHFDTYIEPLVKQYELFRGFMYFNIYLQLTGTI